MKKITNLKKRNSYKMVIEVYKITNLLTSLNLASGREGCQFIVEYILTIVFLFFI